MLSRTRNTAVMMLVLLFGSVYHLSAQPRMKVVLGAGATKQFVYLGKPVHPFCVDFTTHSRRAVDLSSCTDTKVRVNRSRGWIEAEYPQNSRSLFEQPYASYRVFAKRGDSFLVAGTASNGGTAIYESLFWVSMHGSKLRLDRVLSGGDRCNGGTADGYQLKGTSLRFAQNLTPAGILELSSGKPAAGAWEDGAPSCMGQALYRYDIAQDKLKLESVIVVRNSGSSKTVGQTDVATGKVPANSVILH